MPAIEQGQQTESLARQTLPFGGLRRGRNGVLCGLRLPGWIALLGLLALGQSAGRAALALEDWPAIDQGLGIIRQCQLPDGMIRSKGAGAAVWTVPYLGNFGAMALLAAHALHPNTNDVRRVEQWLLWYARHQEPDGTIYDREGTLGAYPSNGRRDSTDAYAATFLMAVWRYQKALGKEPAPEITRAAGLALGAIKAVAQPDGLTLAKPDYPMKYLMDNLEVYGGLREGASFFASAGHPAEAAEARCMAAQAGKGLQAFWSAKDQYFWVGLDRKGVYSGGLTRSYPQGLAQLYALAHLAPERSGLWQRVRQQFRPGDEGMPVERWLMAASRCATPEETQALRQATRQALLGFTVKNVYVDRPALAILALLDGEARFPSVPAVNPSAP